VLISTVSFIVVEWNPSESSLAHLTSANDASDTAPTMTSNLWEDNWDDDDVDEDFSKQLRLVSLPSPHHLDQEKSEGMLSMRARKEPSLVRRGKMSWGEACTMLL
jgi:hypothetical protein